MFRRFLFSRISSSAQDHAVLVLLLNLVGFFISTWPRWSDGNVLYHSCTSFEGASPGGQPLNIFTWFIGAGGCTKLLGIPASKDNSQADSDGSPAMCRRLAHPRQSASSTMRNVRADIHVKSAGASAGRSALKQRLLGVASRMPWCTFDAQPKASEMLVALDKLYICLWLQRAGHCVCLTSPFPGDLPSNWPNKIHDSCQDSDSFSSEWKCVWVLIAFVSPSSRFTTCLRAETVNLNLNQKTWMTSNRFCVYFKSWSWRFDGSSPEKARKNTPPKMPPLNPISRQNYVNSSPSKIEKWIFFGPWQCENPNLRMRSR